MKIIHVVRSFCKTFNYRVSIFTGALLVNSYVSVVLAQLPQPGVSFKVDTSFTVNNEYHKHRENFPFIRVAETGSTSGLIIRENLVYATYQGRELRLDLIHPGVRARGEKFPVVILIHGGGWRSGNKQMDWPMAHELARRGYAAICVEYRLSGEALYPAAVIDVQTAIRWARANAKNYNLDKNRVALVGSSAGGQIAALLGAINGRHPTFTGQFYRERTSKVNAVVNIDGILAFIHPGSGEGQDRPGNPSAATRWFGTPVENDPASRNEASALLHVNKNTAPMLFINSSIPRFHSGRDDMIKKMEKYKITSRVHEYDNAMHTFWLFHPWFTETVERIDLFLKETLEVGY